MRLEDLTISLRPRQPWEAVDLGCSLARRDFGRLLGLWGITVVPLWIVLAVLLHDWPLIFPLVVWWLKPLYDRVPLYFISRAAFGVRPTIKEALKAWPRLWSRFLFSALILRRLSFIRSFALPIWMLEGQRGQAVRTRVKALATDAGSSGAMATWVFFKLEIGVALGLWVLTSYMVPESGMPEFGDYFDETAIKTEVPAAYSWYLNCIYLVALTLIEIFYVGAGFGLYLNSRIKLEGWDIELTFRKLAARLQPVVAAVLLALMTCASLVAAPVNPAIEPAKTAPVVAAPATDKEPAPDEEDPAVSVVKEILAEPDFKIHKRTVKKLVPEEEDPSDDPDDSDDANRSSATLPAAAAILEFLGWLCVSALVGLLVFWLVQNRHIFRFAGRLSRPQEKINGPRVLMGMDITRESLPDDLLTSARAAWQQGRLREALSLLYRGALSRLVEQRRLPIRDSDTEDDCLIHVANTGERTITDYFRQLTLLWVRAAYAGVEAGPDEFDNLCRTWPFDLPAAGRKQAAGLQRSILLGLTLLGLSGCGKYEDVEVTLGYKGKARSDPFLAAQKLLQEFDYTTEKLTLLKKLPEDPESQVLILSGEGGMSEGRARQLLDWVDDGGHLIYALAGCKPYNDWSLFAGFSNYAYFGNEDRQDALLESLSVEASDRRKEFEKAKAEAKKKEPSAKKKKKEKSEDEIQTPEDVSTRRDEVVWGGSKYQLALPDYITFKLDRKLRTGEFAAGPPEKATVLGLRRGLGRVTLLTHARPLRNRYLGDNDHAAWLLDLMGEDFKEVHFILSVESSLWSLLWEKAWMVLTGLAILVVFWLWRHLPRFGPMRHVELHETKHFAEHVSALGQFFHSLRRDDILLGAAGDAVRARVLRRYPHLHSGGDAALLPILIERSGLPEERVKAALAPPAASQPHHLVRLLHDLQTLRQALA